MEKKSANGDSRHKLLDRALSRHQGRPDALIEVLHTAQELFGYIPRDVLAYIAESLKLPRSRVFSVASFYPLFSLTPPAAHTLTVCMGTACYVNGAAALLAEAKQACGCEGAAGGTRVRAAHCLGACGRGPLLQVDRRNIVDANIADVRREVDAVSEYDHDD
ncbi:MAG: NAD(P)H-dependent oxidoreductase subunit E [Bacteroidota bacterium]|nr:NAD(P)H-dependent oxidoreductase subunit E [Bacteroidota bacterium]